MGHIDWVVVFAGRCWQKEREGTSEARRIRVSKLAHERGGITEAAGALLISPPTSPRDHTVLVTLRIKYPTDDPAAMQQVKRGWNNL